MHSRPIAATEAHRRCKGLPTVRVIAESFEVSHKNKVLKTATETGGRTNLDKRHASVQDAISKNLLEAGQIARIMAFSAHSTGQAAARVNFGPQCSKDRC